LLSHFDTSLRNDEAVDRPDDLSPPPFPTDSPTSVTDHGKESRLRNFIRDRYGPPSESASVRSSEQPPPY